MLGPDHQLEKTQSISDFKMSLSPELRAKIKTTFQDISRLFLSAGLILLPVVFSPTTSVEASNPPSTTVQGGGPQEPDAGTTSEPQEPLVIYQHDETFQDESDSSVAVVIYSTDEIYRDGSESSDAVWTFAVFFVVIGFICILKTEGPEVIEKLGRKG